MLTFSLLVRQGGSYYFCILKVLLDNIIVLKALVKLLWIM